MQALLLSACLSVVVASGVTAKKKDCVRIQVDEVRIGLRQHSATNASSKSGLHNGQYFRTLSSALQAVALSRSLSSNSSQRSDLDRVCIFLHSNVTASELPIVLGPRHSKLTIIGVGGPAISGGYKLHSWKMLPKMNDSNTNLSIWVAQAPTSLPCVRQLYVDKARATRTRLWWPSGQWKVSGSSLIGTGANVLASFGALQCDTSSPPELVWTGGCKEHASHCAPGQHSYREARCAVRALTHNTETVNITVAEPCFTRAQTLSSCTVPSYINNVKGLLFGVPGAPQVAGTYFFDPTHGNVFYSASVDWEPSQSEVVLPVGESLLEVKDGAFDINITGVTMEHTTWLEPNTAEGYVDDQASVQAVANGTTYPKDWPSANVPVARANETVKAAVAVWVNQIVFDRCIFRHMGGAALHLQAGSQNSVVSRCVFEDISASAIMVGGITDWAEKDVARQTLNNSVADSTFRNLPQEFHGADSVSVFIAANTTLEHNFFGGSSYSAVSLGWGWHTILGNTSYARANRVIFNDIRDSMQLLFDGGSLYTLGSQPSSEAAYNLIRGLGSCVKTNAIYHDDGSAGWSDHHNVVQINVYPNECGKCEGRDCSNWVLMWTPTIHDCHIFNNWIDVNRSQNAGTNCSISDNVLVNGTNLPPEAHSIIEAVGPRPM